MTEEDKLAEALLLAPPLNGGEWPHEQLSRGQISTVIDELLKKGTLDPLDSLRFDVSGVLPPRTMQLVQDQYRLTQWRK